MNTDGLYQLFKNHPLVVTDSRTIKKGSLFFALKGENFNGNKFAAEAIEKGAAYAIIDEKKYQTGNKTVLVENVLEALQKLAGKHKKELGIPVLGITGSNGKTTTKELIAAVLSEKFRISYTQGNLNNHIGVPLTLLGMDDSTEFGIVEMGANHPGEIAQLCKIADPDYGIITNIGRAHLEGFGSFEAIKKTKAELYDYLKKKNGIIFYNSDNSILSELTKSIRNKISFGSKNADLSGHPVFSPPFINAEVHFPNDNLYFKSKLTGDYNFENIMAAGCIGHYFGVDPQVIQKAIKNYTPGNNRSQLIEKNNLKIIMDAYNANPTSMQASIDSFVSSFSNPRYLILGDMLELGSQELNDHISILEKTKKHSFSEVLLVGNAFTRAAKNFPFKTFITTKSLCHYLAENPINEGAVLIKGSRGIQLEKVLDVL
jgi:UDP-N-acetylmuramoyl-tripeptide--D-alanyl-D-alanine ligase